MRAVAISAYGASPVLTDVAKPQPGPGQILIKVQAASMNPMDRAIASGAWQAMMPATFPLILGADVAGVVEALGEDAKRFSRGDEVFGQLLIPPLGSAGTYAEYVAAGETAPLARIPSGLDPIVAAALPTIGMTALGIADSLQPLRGKTVLVVGAAGGVGSLVVQFAAQAGAQVIATARESEAARVRGYGAVETIDYTQAALLDVVRAKHSDGIDILVDLASDRAAFAGLATLVRRGGTALSTRYVADVDALNAAQVSPVNFQVAASAELLARISESIVAGRVEPPPIVRVKLADVPDVWSRSAQGAKVVVVM